MGVKGLWSLLTPFCDRRPLYELEGKTVAIDLAGWVCEALTVVDYSVQSRNYLRNLFFRACHLLQLGVHPVFVLDGAAPVMKYNTIAARNAIQFKGARPRKEGTIPKPGKDRSGFKSVLKQCEELLNILGIKCVHGWGEAEAMCAYLNADGYVDACVSQDSDCFVYGAKIVYRNFSMSHQGGAIDVYDIAKVPHLGRNKMVVLALLCGCDYNGCGINGVGRDSAIKFIETFSNDDILERVISWRSDSSKFEELERKYNDPDRCTACGHFGKIQKHNRSGCLSCGTNNGCIATEYKERRLSIKNELAIREKALSDPDFPSLDIINEFLKRKDKIPESLDLSWIQPNLVAFVKFMSKKCDWPEIYSFQKILPLLTRWQVLNHEAVSNEAVNLRGILFIECIKKKLRPKGIVSYQILWADKNNYFSGLIDKSQMEEWKINNKQDTLEMFWTTVEPEHLVAKAYPDMVAQFLESKIKKKPTKRKKAIQDLSDSMQKLTISKKTAKPKKITKPKVVAEIEDLNDSLHQLFLTEKPIEPISTNRISQSFEKHIDKKLTEIQTDIKCNIFKNVLPKGNRSFNLSNFSDFESSDDDLNVSDIVENIVSRGNLNLLSFNKV